MPLILKRFLMFLFVLILIVITIATAYVIQHRPTYDGELALENLENPVEVIFDRYGIPHIYAENQTDLYRAFGYLHAQERVFQMDLMRRVGSGRLSELFGPVTLKTDQFFRTIGISQAAKADAAQFLNSESKSTEYTRAYVDGINQFIKNGYSPVEYALLGVEIEPFTVEDIFNTVGYMSFSFAMAQRTEPIAQMILEKYGPEYLEDLDLDSYKNDQMIMNHAPKNDSIELLSLSMGDIMNTLPVSPFVGSNSWVLAPEKTESGKVILANDPHIGFAQPAIWYEAHLVAPDFQFYGYHLAGVPFGIIGHNPQLAWGLTMFENDDIDFFFEKINPDNPVQVWENDHWRDMKSREETFSIKGESDSIITVMETRHGPIINNVLNTGSDTELNVSMYWIYTHFPSKMIEVTYKMARASNLEEMKEIVPLMHAPGLNLMYGDHEGNIAWWATGKLPIRPKHVNSKLILDGSSGKDEYEGFYDFSYNPKSINPPWGYVYSANNRPDSLKGITIPGYYLPEDRAKRIVHLLEENEKWDLEEVKGMMNDVTSSVTPTITNDILDVLESEESSHPLFEKALEKLRNWNGNFETEEVAPTIYNKLIYEIHSLALKDELGSKVLSEFLSTHLGKRSIAPLIRNDTSMWYDNVSTEVIETRSQIFVEAMNNSLELLQEQLGDDINEWQWGKVHSLEHVHPIGRQKPLNRIFNVGPFPMAGTNEVINNMAFGLNGSGYYKTRSGPSKRRIVDFSNVETSYSILPTGQSGNVFSEHYMDQAELFNKGGFRKQMMNRSEIEHYKESELLIVPQ